MGNIMDKLAGDGIADDTAALQALLSSPEPEIRIPAGRYLVTSTLRVPSCKTIVADPDARFILDNATPKHRGDFLITNAHHDDGDTDITIRGGVWDGNFGGCNTKNPDLFDPDAWSGAIVDFQNVRGLRLEDITIANSVTYNLRLCQVDGFEITGVRFQADRIAFNQDGVHLAGCCRNGVIRDVRAVSKGQTNDDLIALNADDCVTRLENRDLVCGPIENIEISDVYAEDCHTAIRLLSVNSTIRNITIRNIEAGVRCFALNADAARYCRTPLFKDADRPGGVGHLDNILIDGFRFHATTNGPKSLICLESNAAEVRLRNLVRDLDKDAAADAPTLLARNVSSMEITYADESGEHVQSLGEDGKAGGQLAVRGQVASIDVKSTKPVREGERFRSHVLLEDGEFLVTSPFGERVHPVTGEVNSFHHGVDGVLWDGRMMVETGICAWDDGTVIATGVLDNLGGQQVVIDHGEGLVTRYCHFEERSLRVKAGDAVKRGQLLGWMGRTGRSTGEHLHFQVELDGNPVDPMPYLRGE